VKVPLILKFSIKYLGARYIVVTIITVTGAKYISGVFGSDIVTDFSVTDDSLVF